MPFLNVSVSNILKTTTQNKIMRFVALWLAGICILMFVLQQFIGVDAVILDRSLMLKQPWTIITSIFAHGSIGHLLANMFALGLFGLILEGRIGPKRVLWLFLISGVVINLVTPYQRSLGASGAIFAILGALIMLRPFMTIWMNMIPMPMFLAGDFLVLTTIIVIVAFVIMGFGIKVAVSSGSEEKRKDGNLRCEYCGKYFKNEEERSYHSH